MAPGISRSEATPRVPGARFPLQQLLSLIAVTGICVSLYRSPIPVFGLGANADPLIAAAKLFSESFVITLLLFLELHKLSGRLTEDGPEKAQVPQFSMETPVRLVSSWGAAVSAVLVNKAIDIQTTAFLQACFLVAAVCLLSETALLLQIAAQASPLARSHYAE